MYVQVYSYVRWVKHLQTSDSAVKHTQFYRSAKPNWRIQTTDFKTEDEKKEKRIIPMSKFNLMTLIHFTGAIKFVTEG
jgi:hypothetical protein